MKMREAGRVVSVAVTVAVAVNDQGRREVLGMAIGASEAETFWTEFLRSLARRGLRGVKLVVSDDHKGLKAAATRILGATWQRCRVGLLKNPVLAGGVCGIMRLQPLRAGVGRPRRDERVASLGRRIRRPEWPTKRRERRRRAA